MIIVGGSKCRGLAEKVAQHLEARLIPLETRKFPDGEVYVRVNGELKEEDVAIIQSFAKEPNDSILELALTIDACRSLNCREVIGVIPYMAYARQDARFNPGEPISIEVLARILSSIGLNHLITVDMHLHRIRDPQKLFKIPFENLTASQLIAEYFTKNFPYEDFIVVGPDVESEQWASKVASYLNTSYVIFEKQRLSPTEVKLTASCSSDFKGKTALVVDDVISTGSTVAEAAKVSTSLGAKKVYVACIHPLLVGSALDKIMLAGASLVVATDSIESPISKISIAPVVAQALKRLMS